MRGIVDRVLDFGERFLERSEIKLILASLIIVSVFPYTQLVNLDLYLLPIFAIELALRLVVTWRAGRFDQRETTLLVIDAVALVTFLPSFVTLEPQLEWVRLVRLIRLIVLARFLRSTLSDLRKIVSQRHLRYQFGFLFSTVLLLTFLGATILKTLKTHIDFDADGRAEEGGLFQVVWWVFRQIEDPGNLIEDPHGDAVLLVTSLVFTIAGVFVMSFIIGIGTSVVGALMAASRHRRVPFREHTVVVGGGRNVASVLEDLVGMYGKNRRRVRVAVLDSDESPPPYLEERTFRGVEYRAGEPTRLDAHELLSTEDCKRVLVLSNDERGEAADAYVISSVLAVRQKNALCPITAEMRHRRYVEVARLAGGPNTKPVPMGKFLGCLMSQSVMFPGIDVIFEDLLNGTGSEIYTHIYTEQELRDLCDDGPCTVSFPALLGNCLSRHAAVPLGVFVGDDSWTPDVSELTLWLNPMDAPPRAALDLGCRAGEVPLAALRGIVAVAPEYSTVRRAAADIRRAIRTDEDDGGADAVDEEEDAVDEEEDAAARPPTISVSLAKPMLELRRFTVLGDNEMLPALMENTAEFVEGVEVVVVTPSIERRDALVEEIRRRSDRATLVESSQATEALTFSLPRGGKATVVGSTGDPLADVVERESSSDAPLDALVLLADLQEIDPDANTALTLFRALETIRDGRLEVGPRFRIVAEVLSAPKGELLEQRFDHASAPVHIVPTQQMRSYFLVHSAYVPGSDRVHLELLSADRQDFCQLRPDALEGDVDEEDELTFAELVELLTAHRPPVICFAVMLGATHATPGLVLNPQGDDSGVRFKLSDIEAIYGVGETAGFSTTSGDRGTKTR